MLAENIDQRHHAAIRAYYALVAPLLDQHFADDPLVYATFPHGFEQPPQFHGPISAQYPPPDAALVNVPSAHGLMRYRALSAAEIHGLVAHAGAIEFHGWTPTPGDPCKARFARLLLELDPKSNPAQLNDGAQLVRAQLQAQGRDAIALVMGTNGIALWIPLEGAPDYPSVRAWLHAFCAQAVSAHPQRFCTEPNTHASGRIHLHVGSNAPGRYSALPYSLRGDDELRVCAPVTWDELPQLAPNPFVAATFPDRLQHRGDLFAQELARIGAGTRIVMAAGAESQHGKAIEPHGDILRAALQVLQDGVPRDAQTILKEALARELVPAGTQAKYFYTSLLEYIVRTSGHGHRPLVVQDADRRFRLNEPLDPWPALPSESPQPLDAATQAVIDRLQRAVHGDDPAAFELAVCDAFAHLGFASTHLGGHQAPDGYADAQLGPLGYRVMLECKTGGACVTNPDAVEASKFKDAYHAQFCALIGPGFAEDTELAGELQLHGVSAWTVDDLATLLRARSHPQEMRALFAPGYVSDAIAPVLWQRLHGASKRVTLICEYLEAEGWNAQVSAAKQGSPQDAPHLTVDAAMLLVDQHLASLPAPQGEPHASCTREEVQAAFDYLSNPRVNRAVWLDGQQTALVVLSPPVG